MRQLGRRAKDGALDSANRSFANRSFANRNGWTGCDAAGESAYGRNAAEYPAAGESAAHEPSRRDDAECNERDAESKRNSEHNTVDESYFAQQSGWASLYRDQWQYGAERNAQPGFDKLEHAKFRNESEQPESGIDAGESGFQ